MYVTTRLLPTRAGRIDAARRDATWLLYITFIASRGKSQYPMHGNSASRAWTDRLGETDESGKKERKGAERRGNNGVRYAFYESALPFGRPALLRLTDALLGMGLRWDRSQGSRRSVTRRRKPVEKKKERGKCRKLRSSRIYVTVVYGSVVPYIS